MIFPKSLLILLIYSIFLPRFWTDCLFPLFETELGVTLCSSSSGYSSRNSLSEIIGLVNPLLLELVIVYSFWGFLVILDIYSGLGLFCAELLAGGFGNYGCSIGIASYWFFLKFFFGKLAN